jgi:hypothetical protein
VFAAVEAQALAALPARPFVLATWSTPRVGPDIHARVGKTIYSVPWRYIGEQVDARETWNTVQFFHKGQLVATHAHRDKGKRTDLSHYPPEKIAFKMRTPFWCRTRAAEVGPHCVAVIAQFVGYRDQEIDTVLGRVRVRRAYYHCRACQRGLVPVTATSA